MLAGLFSLFGLVPWILDKLGVFSPKPRPALALEGLDSLTWVVRVPPDATAALVNHKRVKVKNAGRISAQGVGVLLRFPENFVREVAEMTASFGFPEDETQWRKYPEGRDLILEFVGSKAVPPRDESQLGDLRIPLTGGRVVSERYHVSFRVSADNASPTDGSIVLIVQRSE